MMSGPEAEPLTPIPPQNKEEESFSCIAFFSISLLLASPRYHHSLGSSLPHGYLLSIHSSIVRFPNLGMLTVFMHLFPTHRLSPLLFQFSDVFLIMIIWDITFQ